MDNSKRCYSQFCGLARALDIVGERWTLLIVRNLLLGPQHYSELLRGLPGITTNLLAKRLKELQDVGILEKIKMSSSNKSAAYRLTERGEDLEDAIHALGSWGSVGMDQGPGPNDKRNIEWFLVSLRRRYKGGETLTAELVADDTPYIIKLSQHEAHTARGTARKPDAVVRGTEMEIIRWLRGANVALQKEGETQRLQNAFN